jgi:hypothetical protein
VIKDEKHTGNCAVREDGPCTCGTDEVIEELAFEEAGLTAEDFE